MIPFRILVQLYDIAVMYLLLSFGANFHVCCLRLRLHFLVGGSASYGPGRLSVEMWNPSLIRIVCCIGMLAAVSVIGCGHDVSVRCMLFIIDLIVFSQILAVRLYSRIW